ncbi:MAG: hypothetical protein AAGI36_00885 [Pseudomonadota bacterium]
MQISDLTRTAQELLRLIASDQATGKLKHTLRPLAVKHRAAIHELHSDIEELTKANMLRMERLRHEETGTMVRFHLSGDPVSVLAAIRASTGQE